jgi:hypothetical protein
MTIQQSQTVDLLNKKLASLAKTDWSNAKGLSNETISSPLLVPGSTVWQLDTAIANSSTLPTSNSSVVTVYRDSLSTTIQCTRDGTASGTNQTWLTSLADWIPPSFGSGYQIQLYAAPIGYASNVMTVGVPLSQAGSGNNDSYTFDYQAGVINFADTVVPSPVTWNGTTGNVVYVVGARYTGAKGVAVFPSGLTMGNITIVGNNINSSSGNVTITSNLNIVGNTTFYGYSDLTITDSILNLHTQANLAPWTIDDGKDIGLKMHYYDGADSHAALVRANDSGYLEWYARGTEISGNTFAGSAYGTIKTGTLILANTTPATGPNTGALQVWGGASISGNLYIGNLQADLSIFAAINNTPIGNAVPSTGAFTTLVATTANIGNLQFANTTVTHANVFVFNSNSAIQVPVGNSGDRPAGANGMIRYNTDTPALEYFDGTIWVPVTNTVTDQQITADGTNNTFTLDQQASTVGVIVSINGTLQRPTSAYTVAADQITFTETPEATDVIDVRFLGAAVTVSETIYDDLTILGNLTLTGLLSQTPTTKTSTSPGTAGQVCWDVNYIYVCTATNTWKRVALTGGVF